ncbi:MAG TPA: ATP-binding protein, partial [Rectinemataceae bacterium]|nr:ATP-binding protein [Rectinemataceae bacterium]
MNETTSTIVLLDLLDAGEFKRIAAALHREGLEAREPAAARPAATAGAPLATAPAERGRIITWLDEEVRASGADFVLVDAELWEKVGFEINRSLRSYVIVVLVDSDGEEKADALIRAGAFDGILRGGDGWEEGVAAYFRVLTGLWRRFSGAYGHLERRYEDLVHALPDIVYELDEAGRFTFVNNSVRLLGYEPAELAGKHFSVLLDADEAASVDRDKVLGWFRGAKTGPGFSPKLFNERRGIDRKTENLELRLKRKIGPQGDDLIASIISYGEITSAGEWAEGSSFVGSVGVIRDITLRRKSEDMLRKLYQAVDQLAAGVLVLDADFMVEYANPAFLRMALREPTEVIGSPVFPFFAFDRARADEVARLVGEGFDVREELELLVAGGDRLWVAWHASPVREPSGDVSHSIIVCEDISQTRAMADLLRAAKEEAERADRAKSDFLASMGHELKGPLASIVAAARLAGMENPAMSNRSESIIRSAEGLLELLGDILDFVRFENGSPSIHMVAFPFGAFVKRAVEAWAERARDKGLSFELASVEDMVLYTDPDRLGRAFSALLSNAISFTERGSIRVESSIETRSGNVPHLVLSVVDTGPGIAPADQARIFAPFVQLVSPYAKTAGGAGIGLSLARNIVRALGGEIRLTSEQGSGSRFTILVPAGEIDSAGPALSFADDHRVLRLLVVDDNEINREYMAILLANAGHRMLLAGSGAEALRVLEETQPDAAILDIQMPGMSGIELGRKIRGYQGDRYDRQLPLVALTAFGPEEVTRSSSDFDRVFSKPAD